MCYKVYESLKGLTDVSYSLTQKILDGFWYNFTSEQYYAW